MEFFGGYETSIIAEVVVDTYCNLKDPNYHAFLLKTHPIVHQQMYS